MSLKAAVDALRAKDPERALAHLDQAEIDEERLAARALSLRAQALYQLDRLPEAADTAHRAAAAVKRLDDPTGLREVRSLRDRILATQAGQAALEAHQRTAATLADTPLPVLLVGARSDQERADVVLKKADALADRGRGREAAALARSLLDDQPPSPRAEVLALLVLVRCSPADAPAWLTRARDVADRAGEAQLVTAVAAAARVVGHVFPPEVF